MFVSRRTSPALQTFRKSPLGSRPSEAPPEGMIESGYGLPLRDTTKGSSAKNVAESDAPMPKPDIARQTQGVPAADFSETKGLALFYRYEGTGWKRQRWNYPSLSVGGPAIGNSTLPIPFSRAPGVEKGCRHRGQESRRREHKRPREICYPSYAPESLSASVLRSPLISRWTSASFNRSRRR